MSNPFQEQFLKAGVVNKEQIQKVKQDKHKKNKLQRSKKNVSVDEAKLRAKQVVNDKAEHDRILNKKREDDARKKAISSEINQLIVSNRIHRDESCETIYNFEHNKKVKRIYINDEQKKLIVQGKLGIARIEGRYELVPLSIAEKIQQRNEKRIIIIGNEEQTIDENDPYADYKVPDDLMW